jgi:hypothetical protein
MRWSTSSTGRGRAGHLAAGVLAGSTGPGTRPRCGQAGARRDLVQPAGRRATRSIPKPCGPAAARDWAGRARADRAWRRRPQLAGRVLRARGAHGQHFVAAYRRPRRCPMHGSRRCWRLRRPSGRAPVAVQQQRGRGHLQALVPRPIGQAAAPWPPTRASPKPRAKLGFGADRGAHRAVAPRRKPWPAAVVGVWPTASIQSAPQ